MRSKALISVVFVGSLLLTACSQPSSDYQAPAPESATAEATSPSAADQVDGAGGTGEETSASPSASAIVVGTAVNPAPYGTPVEIGDYTVTVNSINATDANALIAKENQFNSPPENGQFVLANITFTNNGTEVASSSNLTFNFVGADNLLYTNTYTSIPDDISSEPQTLTGGTISGNVVFDIPAEAVGKGAIAVSGYTSQNGPVVWAGA